jgi:hypothetical protein
MLYPNRTGRMTKGEKRPLAGRLMVGVLFALLVTAIYADPLFNRRNFAGRDLLPYNLPVEKAIHDAYERGRLPVWFSEVSGGRPLLPDPNCGALYPLRPALSHFSFAAAFRIYPVLHWIAAGIGMMLLLRVLGVSIAGAWVAAVGYVFSGVGVSEVFYTNYQPGMALLPWILWAAARPAGTGKVPLLALLYGLDFLAGDVFTVGLALLGSLLWILFEPEPRTRRSEALRLTGALALAALLAAPQVLATALWIPHTRRAVVGLKLNEALAFSLSPWRLLEILVPYPFGATWDLSGSENWGRTVFRNFFATLYCGSVAVAGAVLLARTRTRAARLLRTFLLISLVLCAAPSLAPASWGSWSSPVPLRYPEKLSVGIVFALSAAGGLAVDEMRRAERLPRWMLPVGALLAALASAAAVLPDRVGRVAAAAVRAPRSVAGEAGREIPAALGEAGLFWMATLAALELLRSQRTRASGTALAILTMVPVLANRRVAQSFPEESVFSPTPFARALERRDPADDERVVDASRYRPDSPLSVGSLADPAGLDFYRRRWFFYTHALWGRSTVFNTDPDVGDFSRMQSLREVSSFLAASSAGHSLFSTLGLRFGIRFRDQEPLPGYRRFGGDALQDWDWNPEALASVRLLERWREEASALDALRDLPALAPGEVAIETGRNARGVARLGVVRLVENTPERLRLELGAPDPSWLFVLRGFWPYRTVRLDGGPIEVFPGHLAFSAVAIPPGRHRVDWAEDVPGLEISWLGPVAGGLIAVVLAWKGWRARLQEQGV